MSAPQQNEAEKNIEIWKVKKLIKRLEAARGNGTSMISLIIRKNTFESLFTSNDVSETRRLTSFCGLAPKDQVSRAAKMLAEEFVRLSHYPGL
jgi:peptide chain release factor subunit 1